MSLRTVAIAVGFLMLALAGYGLWKRAQSPPRIVSTGTVEVGDPHNATGARKRLLTRVVEIGSVTLNEIELPNGTWIDCSGDCAGTARKATADFWDEKQKAKK